MTILDWPIEERPREKLLKHGANQLSDAELLAIFLGSGTKGKSAVDLSRDLINHFGSLRKIFTATYRDFCAFPGLGPSKYCHCQAAAELNRRQLQQSLEKNCVITDPNHAKKFLIAQLRDQPQEVFSCLFMDNRHRLIQFEHLFFGTINSTNVYPRTLIQRCLFHNAAAIIIAHNHPSGITQPSQADQEITDSLKKALEIVDIRLLDHMIVGDNQIYSFAEAGLLAPSEPI
jgi:DNA repair protein RadC